MSDERLTKVAHVLGAFSGATRCGLELRWHPYLRILYVEDFAVDQRKCQRCVRSLNAANRRLVR